MLSKQAQAAIEFSRKYIKPGQAEPLTAEMIKAARQSADQGNQYDFPDNVQMEVIDEHRVHGELYHVDGNSHPRAVLMFLHGGAYATGTVKSRRKLAVTLGLKVSVDVFSVDYTQYPEGKHPAAQLDVEAAYHYLHERYGKVVLFGESAGASLALTLTLSLKKQNLPLPERLAVFSPVITQLNILASEYLNQDRDPMLLGAGAPVPYFDEPAKHDPLISPIYGDYHGFPPMMINCGSEEVKYDDAVILNYLCTTAGSQSILKVWPGLFHVFVLFDMPETDQALTQIADFLREGI